jgi:prepilin-type N-terminal cleavage/methylation domain-containing protein
MWVSLAVLANPSKARAFRASAAARAACIPIRAEEPLVNRTRDRSRGFTLIELLTVVGLIAILTTMAALTFGRQTPRSRLDSGALELRALLFGARQEALARGHRVAVLFFPAYDPRGWTTGVGRVVVYEDPDENLFTSFDAFDPAAPSAAAGDEVLEVVDLPRTVRLATAGALRSLPAPLSGVVLAPCDFCDAGGDGRGAIAFDAQGRATFHSENGPALDRPVGSSFAIESADVPAERRGLVVLSRTGAVQTLADNP